jgi:hypothetical protein
MAIAAADTLLPRLPKKSDFYDHPRDRALSVAVTLTHHFLTV